MTNYLFTIDAFLEQKEATPQYVPDLKKFKSASPGALKTPASSFKSSKIFNFICFKFWLIQKRAKHFHTLSIAFRM
jgi:hypothetical protein